MTTTGSLTPSVDCVVWQCSLPVIACRRVWAPQLQRAHLGECYWRRPPSPGAHRTRWSQSPPGLTLYSDSPAVDRRKELVLNETMQVLASVVLIVLIDVTTLCSSTGFGDTMSLISCCIFLIAKALRPLSLGSVLLRLPWLYCDLLLPRSWKLACLPSWHRAGAGSWFRLSVLPDIMVAYSAEKVAQWNSEKLQGTQCSLNIHCTLYWFYTISIVANVITQTLSSGLLLILALFWQKRWLDTQKQSQKQFETICLLQWNHSSLYQCTNTLAIMHCSWLKTNT